MRKLFATLAVGLSFVVSANAQTTPEARHFAEYLTTEQFRQNIFDYKAHKEWSYNGAKPCMIDFYATWCGPCKMLSPIVEELAKQYDGKVNIYKVDVDKEKELAAVFGVRSIPTLLYIPVGQQPTVTQGAMEKEALEELINVILLGQKPKNMKMWQSEEAAE